MAKAVRTPNGDIELVQVQKAGGIMLHDVGWSDATMNLVRAVHTKTLDVGWHCRKKSPACANCYAESINRQHGTKLEYHARHALNGDVVQVLDTQRLEAALRWKPPRGYVPVAGDGRVKVFVADMIDLFDESVPTPMIVTHFALAMLRPDIDWLMLTKVIERAAALTNDPAFWAAMAMKVQQLAQRYGVTATPSMYMPEAMEIPPRNVWLGATFEDQTRADERIGHLMSCNAAVRFLCCEPVLGDIEIGFDDCSRWVCPECGSSDVDPEVHPFPDDLATWECHSCNAQGDIGADATWKSMIDWVIVGCESLAGKAGCESDVYLQRAGKIIEQCHASCVRVYHKQWPIDGRVVKDLETLPEALRVRRWPKRESQG